MSLVRRRVVLTEIWLPRRVSRPYAGPFHTGASMATLCPVTGPRHKCQRHSKPCRLHSSARAAFGLNWNTMQMPELGTLVRAVEGAVKDRTAGRAAAEGGPGLGGTSEIHRNKI